MWVQVGADMKVQLLWSQVSHPQDHIFNRSTLKNFQYSPSQDLPCPVPSSVQFKYKFKSNKLWHIHINMTAHMSRLRWDPLYGAGILMYNLQGAYKQKTLIVRQNFTSKFFLTCTLSIVPHFFQCSFHRQSASTKSATVLFLAPSSGSF